MSAHPRHRLGRAHCPACGRECAAYVPRHGTGTHYRPVWHKVDGAACQGRFDLVDVLDLVREPFDGRSTQ